MIGYSLYLQRLIPNNANNAAKSTLRTYYSVLEKVHFMIKEHNYSGGFLCSARYYWSVYNVGVLLSQ